MNMLVAIMVIAVSGALHAAEEIPVRDPKIGESRPSWWLSLWANHVVVIEGTIEWNQERDPEIQIEADLKALDKALDEDDVDLFKSTGKFRLGRIEPKKVLFASPGITLENLTIGRIAAGWHSRLHFLLPVMEVEGHGFTSNAKSGDSGVFIFRYGSIVSSLPLVFDGPIPEDGIDSAKAVFYHRNRFDHRLQRNRQGERRRH